MRLLPFLASAIVTVSLVTLFNIQLPVGGSKTPKLGYFLSPQQGFWKNAEKVNTNFDYLCGSITFAKDPLCF